MGESDGFRHWGALGIGALVPLLILVLVGAGFALLVVLRSDWLEEPPSDEMWPPPPHSAETTVKPVATPNRPVTTVVDRPAEVRPKPEDPAVPLAGKKPIRKDGKWELVFEDDFEKRGKPGKGWKILSGEWSVEDGYLCGRPPKGKWGGAEICLPGVDARDLVRLEYSGYVEGLHNPNRGIDLSANLGLDPKTGKGCYFFAFNGASDHGSHIDYGGEVLQKRLGKGMQPESAETYKVVIERIPPKIRMKVNGKVVLEVDDPVIGPMRTGKSISLYTYGSYAFFEDVRLWVSRRERFQPGTPPPRHKDEAF